MNKNLEAILEKTFPFMKRIDNGTDYSELGCECGDGWYELIHDMCAEITDVYCRNKIPIDIKVERIYKIMPRLWMDMTFQNEHDDSFKEQIYVILEKYGKKSLTVCEVCGKAGKYRDIYAKWSQALCENCLINEVEKSALINCRRETLGYSTSTYLQLLTHIKENHCVSFHDLCKAANNGHPEWTKYIRSNPRLMVKMMGKYGRSVVNA